MKRYFFDLIDSSGVTDDEEGVELPDPSTLRRRAIREARAIMAAGLLEGTLDLSGRIIVRDQQGEVVLALKFDEAVKIAHPDANGDR